MFERKITTKELKTVHGHQWIFNKENLVPGYGAQLAPKQKRVLPQ